MISRDSLLSILILGAVAWSVFPATSTELPKEGACHVSSKLDGKLELDKSNAVGSNAIESWGETHTTTVDCGQTQWPAIKERRCYGFDELIGSLRFSSGYCLDTDPDGDRILWKLVPSKRGRNSAMSNDSAEVLMAGGKYKGMSGKLTSRCGYSGSEVEWTGLCDGEMTFKFP
jgi:hypothetical protein